MTLFQLLRNDQRQVIRDSTRKMIGLPTVRSQVYPNGCRKRMAFAISRELSGSLAGAFTTTFKVQHDDLRDAAHGGLLQTGFDMLFGDYNGNLIPYTLEKQDLTIGLHIGFFRNTYVAGGPNRGYLYYNNSELITSQQNRLQTWPTFLSVHHLPSKADDSGNARNFGADAPTGAEIIGPSGSFNGATQFIEQPCTFLNGRNTLQFSFLADAAVIPTDGAAWGIVSNTDTGIFFRYDSSGTLGQVNCVAFGYYYSGGGVRYETDANTVDGNLHHWLVQIAPGVPPKLYRDGILLPWLYKSVPDNAIPTGTFQFTNLNYRVGKGEDKYWNGLLDELRMNAVLYTLPAQVLAEANNLLNLTDYITFSDPEDLTSHRSPFNEKQSISVTSPDPIDVQVDKYAFNPDGLAMSIQALSIPTVGAVSQVGGNTARFMATSSTDVTSRFDATLGAGGKNVKVPIIVAVKGTIIVNPPPSPEYPDALRIVDIPNQAAYNNWLSAGPRPGDRLTFSDGNFSLGTLAFSGTAPSGAVWNAITFVAKNRGLGHVTLTGDLTVNGHDIIFHGFDFTQRVVVLGKNSDRSRVIRCLWHDVPAQSNDKMFLVLSGVDQHIGYCEQYNFKSRGIQLDAKGGCRRPLVYYTYLHDWNYTADPTAQVKEGLQVGSDNTTSRIVVGAKLMICRFENMNQGNKEKEAISNKSSGNDFYLITAVKARTLSQRHGINCRWIACRVDDAGASKSGGFVIRDGTTDRTTADRHYGCATYNGADLTVEAGDIVPTDPNWPSPNHYVSSLNPSFYDCKYASWEIGSTTSASTKPCDGAREYGRRGAAPSLNGSHQINTQTGLALPAGYVIVREREVLASEVGIDAPWLGVPTIPTVG